MDKRGKPSWRKVGKELAALRERSGLTQSEVAPHIRVVPAHISAWEKGKRGMTQQQAEALDRTLNGNGRLVRVWKSANSPEKLPDWYDKVPELERAVTELREYQCQLIPGLIQTFDYARATIQDSLPWASAADVARMVESRMERQEILHKDHPPLVSMVVESSVLRRIVGDECIQIGQLDSILSLIDEGKLRFQVTPPNARRHPGTAGPFRIYTFRDNPALASAEYAGGEVMMDDLEKVQKRMTIFGFLQTDALSLEATVDLVRKVRKSIDE